MTESILVQIIGAPIACKDGIKDSWREVALWAEGLLTERFEDAVQVEYYNLFDSKCPPMPSGAQLPIVLVNGQTVISGGKISIPVIRRKIQALLQKEIA